MNPLPVGLGVTVEVPATSANLGPGFDCFGLALDWCDRARLEVADGFRAEVSGEGAGLLPTGADHLVLASARRALSSLGVQVPGLVLQAHNTIPHGRGLGSSSAAIAAGLLGAAGLVAAAGGAVRPVEPADWLELATDIEGHPDNVAAALLGGFVLAYVPLSGSTRVATVCPAVHPDVRALVFVPGVAVSTERARGLLPAQVPHTDAATNSARSALLVHALGHDPSLLFEATADRLHQSYRFEAMPESARLLRSLRETGCAAVISGAGPSVLVLGRPDELDLARGLAPAGFAVFDHRVGPGARLSG